MSYVCVSEMDLIAHDIEVEQQFSLNPSSKTLDLSRHLRHSSSFCVVSGHQFQMTITVASSPGL
jgi:hypothetical protein